MRYRALSRAFTEIPSAIKQYARRSAIWPVLESTYGRDDAAQWWMRWRIFFMSCAELFGYDRGQQWWVSHYLFERRA